MQEAVKGVDSEASLRLNNFYIKNSKIKTRKETNPEVNALLEQHAPKSLITFWGTATEVNGPAAAKWFLGFPKSYRASWESLELLYTFTSTFWNQRRANQEDTQQFRVLNPSLSTWDQWRWLLALKQFMLELSSAQRSRRSPLSPRLL